MKLWMLTHELSQINNLCAKNEFYNKVDFIFGKLQKLSLRNYSGQNVMISSLSFVIYPTFKTKDDNYDELVIEIEY